MNTDVQGRRLRFAPPNPRDEDGDIIPQPADLKVWEFINRHGPLPLPFLHQFDDRTNFPNIQKRYTRFYHAGWVSRPEQQYASFHARYSPLVYDLTAKSRALLEGPLIHRKDAFQHRLMTACVTSSLELTDGNIRFFEAGVHSVVPDALFSIPLSNGRVRSSALEVDRNTESIERKNLGYNTISKKVANYVDAMRLKSYKEWWGFENFGVLIVTTNATHAQNILEHIRSTVEPLYVKRFAVQVVPNFGSNWRVPKVPFTQLLDEPWTTVVGTKIINEP